MKKSHLSLQLIPVGTVDPYPIIDAAIEVIQASGVAYEVHAFATVMEGELSELMELVEKVKEAAFRAGGEELILNIQIHTHKTEAISMSSKLAKYRNI